MKAFVSCITLSGSCPSWLDWLTWVSPLVESWSSIAFKISQQWYQLTTADASYPVSIFQLNGAGASLSARASLNRSQNWPAFPGRWQKSCPEPAFLQWKCRLGQTGSSTALVQTRYKQSKLEESGPLSPLVQCKMLLQTELCIKQSILFLQLHAC